MPLPRPTLPRPMLPRRALVALAMLAAVACGDATGPGGLSRAAARWEAHGPVSYRVTIERHCYCLDEAVGPVVVTVRDGQVERRTYEHSGAPVGPQFAELFPAVPGLFEIVANAARQRAVQLDVTYDARYGHPTRIVIDYRTNVADDEITWLARDLQPL